MNNTILITGGGSGIGLALARQWVQAGHTVILCGRRADVLEEAKAALERGGAVVHTIQGDVATAESRIALHRAAIARFPEINWLVNNAGIQRPFHVVNDCDDLDWPGTELEIAINLHAPIHLASLFARHLQSKDRGTIAMVTSGISFAPLANVPVYCATKAALHSFTWSLRHQLKSTGIRVVEIVPPAVDTDLQGPGLHTFGVNADVFAASVCARVAAGEDEVGYGMAEDRRLAYRQTNEGPFELMNGVASH